MPKVFKMPKVPKVPKVQYCRPRQTIADHGRPKHSDFRGATSISDAFISKLAFREFRPSVQPLIGLSVLNRPRQTRADQNDPSRLR